MSKVKLYLSKSGRWFTSCVILLLTIISNCTAQCSLSCNNGLNVSLGINCTAEITPDLILEGDFSGCTGPILIQVMDADGNLIPNNPIVDANYLNQSLTVMVTDQATGAGCQGSIFIEDYGAPTILCNDIEISCNASAHPDDIGYPVVNDSCDPNPTLTYSDQVNDLACNPDDYVQQIIRTWMATDASGNIAATCVQTISRMRPLLADIVFPNDKNDIEDPSLDCTNPDTTPSNTGFPTIDGIPIDNNGPCGFWFYHTDTPPTPTCEGSFVIVRTWTVNTSWCGNAASITDTQFIKVLDKTAPTINCPSNFSVNANTTTCTGNITIPAATASDNCSSESNISIQITGPNGPVTANQTINLPVGVYTFTYTATDDCGNTSTCSTTATITDGVAPVAICISSTTVGLTNTPPTLVNASTFDDGSYDNCGPITYLARRMDNPNCPGNDATAFNTTIPFSCCDVGSTVMIEFQVTDAGTQLSNTCMVEVLVQDNLPMTLTCPANVTINCDQDYTDLNITGEATGSDNCGINDLSYTDDLSGLGTCNIGQIIRTWTLTDSYGATTSCNQIITSISTGNGVVNFPPDVLNAECGDANDVSITGVPTTSGNCNQYGFGSTDLVFFLQDSCVRKVLRTWIVMDWCTGESLSQVQLIEETDTQAPVIIGVPSNMTVECDAVPTPANVNATDDCTSPSLVFEETSVITGCETILTRTWTATDNCGNQSSASQVITVTDSAAPTFNNIPSDENVECDNIPAAPTVSASDNCSDPTVTLNEISTPGICEETFTITRVWTATDDCGNTNSIQQTINVSDNTAPIISGVPSNIDVSCDNIPAAASPSATDNCDPNPTITIEETTIVGPCDQSYSIIRTWVASDNCGNTSSASQTLNVSDNTAPVLNNVPEDVTTSCGNIPLPGNITASDNCDPNPTISFDDSFSGGGCFSEFSITRIWTATDDCGNVSTASQVVTVVDMEDPVLTNVPADVSVECDNIPEPVNPTATDDCTTSPIVTLDSNIIPGTCEDTHTIIRTWTATDLCGNTSTASQTINVSDNTNPTLSGVPADLTVECSNIPLPANPVASDNCDPNPSVSFTQTGDPTAGCSGDFEIVRTWTVTDRCGNQITQSQTITLIDTTAPTIAGVPNDLTLECDEAIPNPANPTATDDCDNNVNLSFEETSAPGDCPNSTIITRTWTATDFCNNQTTETQIITIDDNTDPIFTSIPLSITVSCDEIPDVTTLIATDNCDDDVTITFEEITNAGGCTAEFGIVRIWTATDNCGNSKSVSQIITTIDEEAPVFSELPMSMEIECDMVPPPAELTASDNCDTDVVVTFVEGSTPGMCENTFTLIRTWTATDDCGNTAVHTQTLDVEDMTTPFIEPIIPVISVTCENIPAPVTPNPTDNCDDDVDLVFEEINNSGSCNNGIFTIVRTWTATDNCGNNIVQVQTINVTDNTPPTLVDVPADVTIECDLIPAPTVTATDACDSDVEVTLSESTEAGICPNTYILTRTWTATDDCGNTDIGTQVITVTDNTAPVLSGVPTDMTVECDAIPDPPNVVITDNCDMSPSMTFSEISNPGDCPNSLTIVRTWSALDACDNFISATQTITVIDSQGPVLTGVPADITVDCEAVPTVPTVTAVDNCDEDVSVTFTETSEPTCTNSYEITRTWESVDDCGNNSVAVQTITVEDNIPPTIVCPVDTTFRFLGEFVPPIYCKVKDFIQVHATDNCTAVEDITITWTMDYGLNGPDGVIDSSGTITNMLPNATLSDSFEVGVTLFVFTATDECGNTSTCSSTEIVIDNVAPSFSAFPVTTTLAFDFVTGEYASSTTPDQYIFFLDDCCADPEVHFYLPDGSFADELFWDCDDTDFLPSGVITPIIVIDCWGNFTIVSPFTIVNPPNENPNPCGPTPPAASFITGMTYTENSQNIEDVTVNLTGGLSASTTTDSAGYYQFMGLPTNSNYTVSPELDSNPLNGVSTYDLVLISKHLLELQLLDSPYKMIAADIDNNGLITTFDIVQLKRLILGIDMDFANNTSWRFVDANFVFPDPQNPFSTVFPEQYAINDLYSGENLINFVGVKIGDVNGTVTTNLGDLADTRTSALHFETVDQMTKAGELVEIEFTAKDFSQINGFQFTLNFATEALAYHGFKSGVLSGLSEDDFGQALLDKGMLTCSWFDLADQSFADSEVLFTLQFEAKVDAPLNRLVSLTSDYTKAEAYSDVTRRSVELRFNEIIFEEVTNEINTIELYQNRPNPFKDQTIISFKMPKTDLVAFEIFDATGKSCFKQRQMFEIGYQEIVIEAADLPAAGIYYYELSSSAETANGKMILVK